MGLARKRLVRMPIPQQARTGLLDSAQLLVRHAVPMPGLRPRRARRRDDLQVPGGFRSGVPEGVSLVVRLGARLRAALGQLYSCYRRAAPTLSKLVREEETMPVLAEGLRAVQQDLASSGALPCMAMVICKVGPVIVAE